MHTRLGFGSILSTTPNSKSLVEMLNFIVNSGAVLSIFISKVFIASLFPALSVE